MLTLLGYNSFDEAFITAVMLLKLELIRKCVSIAKAKGLKLYEKIKERKGANEADKKAE